MPLKQWTVRTVALAAGIAASWQCVRLALADHEFRKLTRDSLRHAVQWDSGNTRYLLTLAQLDEPAALLARAAALSPYDAGIRVRLGLHAEAAGDYAQAERWLLEAARLSRRYEPRWTLANFYFRRANETEFRRWAREALAVSYGDRTPLFDLCGAMGECVDILPECREVRLAYAQYAAARSKAGDASALIERLAATVAADSEVRPIQDLCRALMAEYHAAAAFRCAASIAPEQVFGWHAEQTRGVGVYPRAAGGWSVSLDGTQPESVELMWRYHAVTGGRCTLDVELHGAIDGLRWTIEQHAPQRRRLEVEFQAPPGLSAVRIGLRYERPAGAMRREAIIEIEHAGVSCQP
jgi:tetratricopeptide (TPR) repeat protein